MGFLGGMLSAVVITALTPVAKDVVNVAPGENPNNTKSLLNSAANDLIDGDIL